jgi:hypothetical protein
MKVPTRKLLLTLGAPLLFTACATIGPPLPPSLELPKPPSDLRATRKGDKVLLSWTVPGVTTDRKAIRSMGATRVCRSFEPSLTECGTPVSEATPATAVAVTKKGVTGKLQASSTDTLPMKTQRENPLGYATYAVEVLNANGRGAGLSNQVKVPLTETLSPPQDFAARVTDKGVVLTWTAKSAGPPSVLPVRYVYRIYRRPEGSEKEILVGEAGAGAETNFTLTDPSIEWEENYEYHANATTVIAQEGKPEVQVQGADTTEVKVFTHDVFPPGVPSGLQAVFSGPGQKAFIDLIWAPVTDMDLAGYNVYRHEEGGQVIKINEEPLKPPAYRDAAIAPGKTYFYSVSAVDLRGNESARSEEANEAVP